MDRIKIHARVTREIEVTPKEAKLLMKHSQEKWLSDEEKEQLKKILERFTDGINSGNGEKGYIPAGWLEEDLCEGHVQMKSGCSYYDINF